MNGKAWISSSWLRGLLLLVLGAPCAFAAAADSSAPGAGEKKGPEMSPEARILGDPDHPDPPAEGSFAPDPSYDEEPYDAVAQLAIYGEKHLNRTAMPPLSLGRRLYDRGVFEPRPTWLGAKNPINYHLMAYGDLRVAGAYYDNGVAAANGKTEQSVIATRLNLDLDLALTATERIHAFVRPLDKNGSFTRYQISGGVEDELVDELDFDLENLYFEGDLGAITQGLSGRTNSLDLPIALGRVPLFTQNGIWLDDALDCLATSITAKHSAALDISNFDLTFFAAFNDLTTAAVPDSDDNARVFGFAGFADAREGYAEFGYGYVDADDSDLSYHNLTAAFTRRYGGRVANSVRLIGNFGQNATTKTADGLVVLLENSLIPRRPLNAIPSPINFVPYFNLFAGFDTPQPLARAAGTGGMLKNTGINFESDGLTGYPTLDDGANESYGGALGVEYLFNLDRQIVLEAAVVERMGSSPLGSQYALGARYQHRISNAWLVRLDAMHGWRQGLDDVFGVRLEIRRKL
jgi:hypothetical protein